MHNYWEQTKRKTADKSVKDIAHLNGMTTFDVRSIDREQKNSDFKKSSVDI